MFQTGQPVATGGSGIRPLQESETLRDNISDLNLIMKQCGAMSRQFNELAMVFSWCTNKPLNEYEWAVISRAIEVLMEGRFGENQSWDNARDEASAYWKKMAEGSGSGGK